ncbi:GntR family transcriptional regulator [Limibaculum sp. M0105]|uniref:GntR family transcriptional regulator n=1 Tax=Thermohalobaculum xanthum TaxID=2753746 RepID=A0A8J7SF75_9RHOB|nr:GntR family transcriptional regulator [Thermohalobaculum xanthum]MBK0398285.1 GntR family transcriptional regulator [Thermohalobaculum xanthum]
MNDVRIKPLSTSHRAYEELRDLIFRGELAAGSDHLETELAERLGMSRTPVREAALMLEAQGLLEVRPRKGVRILPISPDDMREIYEVLTELESLAAERAAAAGYDDPDLKALSVAMDDMDVALASKDLEAWARADDAFHTELVRLGGNSRVCSIVTMMADQVRRARLVTLHLRPLPTKSNEDHRAVLEAIRNHDPALARKLHRAHRADAMAMLLDLIERSRLRHL